MTKEYIEREAVSRTIEHYDPAYCFVLDYVPAADVVEVVRCGQCRFNCYVQSDGIVHCCRESILGFGTVFRKETDYCSYGKRKDGADHA